MKYKVYYTKGFPGRVGKFFKPGKTHKFIRAVEADGRDDAFRQMQGLNWSPHGEARSIIRKAGVSHTSMSVGDVLVDHRSRAWVCASVGWQAIQHDDD